jgi:hypothetical protein
MAKKTKKAPKEASVLFQKIIKASVKKPVKKVENKGEKR